MKKLLYLISMLISFATHAQNYGCFTPGVRQYFINGDNYLRGMRIDSVRTTGDTTIFYPFHTPRGPYQSSSWSTLDSNGGSWLGKKVLALNNGKYIFDNLWFDSVIIETHAHIGDNWIFLKDTSSLYYKATIISEDTMSVLGAVDSIKTIVVTAEGPASLVATDRVDSFQIILSKNNGFMQVFELYTFPYRKKLDSAFVAGNDYFMDKCAKGVYSITPNPAQAIFKLVDLINPTEDQLYDFNPGDVYQYKECNQPNGFGCDVIYSSETLVRSHYETDSITVKLLSSTGTVYYFDGGATQPNPFAFHSSGTATATFANSLLLIDTTRMPEQYKQRTEYHYHPNDISYCVNSPSYYVNSNGLSGTIVLYTGLGGYETSTYKLGLGQVYFYSKRDGMFAFYEINRSELVYYKRASGTCGTLQTAVRNITTSTTTSIYPNPANTTITISTQYQIEHLSVTNLLGKCILQQTPYSNKTEINVSTLPQGIYILRVNNAEVHKFLKE